MLQLDVTIASGRLIDGRDGASVVVVADDGGPGSRRAVDRAAEEAHRRGTGAAVVRSPGELDLLIGRADLVVIDGATAGAVSGSFGCPVLVCGATPVSTPDSTDALRRPEVVAGIHRAEEIPALLPVATREAAVRGIPLCVFTGGRTAADRLVEAALHAEERVSWRLVRTMGERPSAALLRYVEPDDLLVLGAAGTVRLTGHAAGSVTRAVLAALPCDVLLVPMEQPAGTHDEEERHE